MNIKRIALLAATAGALALGACSGGNDTDQPTANVENMAPIEVVNESPVAIEASPAPLVDNLTTTDVEPVPSDLTPDEQTQDDADATGMTARVSRDEGGNEAQPAE